MLAYGGRTNPSNIQGGFGGSNSGKDPSDPSNYRPIALTGCLCKILERMHDNATPHSANLTRQWLQRHGWEILPHPAHSPDLAPSDFHLFGPLMRHLGGMAFETEDDLISELRNWFDNLDIDFFRVGIIRCCHAGKNPSISPGITLRSSKRVNFNLSLQAIQSKNFKVIDIRHLYNLIRKFSPYVHISFVWIPAHMGIQGNENVDKLAKAALNRASCSGKLIRWSDLKPKINTYINSVWQKNWDAEGAKSSTMCSPTWAKTSTGEAKEPVENRRPQCAGFGWATRRATF
ncbi:histone-lysine N-methyltransferase SETMAR [Plakobranchus ocellatus]|uniref:Histone-lysine N-methyltransferase SETMAR n=1 Tax=Plakobranchus ocellatus TaxID=259542 RepID=A0AAV3Y7P1_9GAST|nr:histone-lysine N-methyltransferase SETMAR [Plakobranchus ocellatus]